jgi:hypothetical protein
LVFPTCLKLNSATTKNIDLYGNEYQNEYRAELVHMGSKEEYEACSQERMDSKWSTQEL